MNTSNYRTNQMMNLSTISSDQGQDKERRAVQRKLEKQKKKEKRKRKALKKKMLNENKKINRIEKRDARIKKRLDDEKKRMRSLHMKFSSIIPEKVINKIALGTRYVKRIDLKILPVPFILTLVCTMLGDGSSTLVLLAANMNEWFDILVKPQALSQRMDKKESVKFLQLVLKECVGNVLKIAFKNKYSHLFGMFTSVKIEDSTQIKLNERVNGFKGNGGSSSKSAMKLNVVYGMTDNTVADVNIVSGSTPDQELSKDVEFRIKKGELWIRDLGYFSTKAMSIIHKIGGYFISRFRKGVNIYAEENDITPINVYTLLEDRTKNGTSLDKDVYIGELNSRLKVRLIGEKVPLDVQQKRISAYKKNIIKRNKNKEMKKDYFEWFGYSIFITNIGREMFAFADVILAIYKIRWQIELFFKRVKSTLKINIIKGESKNRVLCLIYAKLISLMMAQSIVSYAASICGDEELSEDKLMKWLKDNNRLGRSIIKTEMEDLLINLLRTLLLLCKDKRKRRKSTFKQLEEAFMREHEEQDKIGDIAM